MQTIRPSISTSDEQISEAIATGDFDADVAPESGAQVITWGFHRSLREQFNTASLGSGRVGPRHVEY